MLVGLNAVDERTNNDGNPNRAPCEVDAVRQRDVDGVEEDAEGTQGQRGSTKGYIPTRMLTML